MQLVTKEDYSALINIGMERAAIACMVNYPDTISDFAFNLNERDFAKAENAVLFSLIKGMATESKPVDVVSIINEAEKNGLDGVFGGTQKTASYVSTLVNVPIIPEQVHYCTGELKQCSFRRASFMNAATIQKKMLETPKGTISDLLSFQEASLSALALEQNDMSLHKITEHGKEVLDERATMPVETVGIPTGFTFLDDRLSGLRRRSLTVVAARAKVGKSALLTGWGIYAAVNLGVPVLYISTEMSTEEDMMRSMGMLSGVPIREIERGVYAQDKRKLEAVNTAYNILDSSNYYHEYMPDFTFDKILSLTRMFLLKVVGKTIIGGKETVRDCLVIFDYIKIGDALEFDGEEYQQLGTFTSSLKNILAGKLDIPVLTAAQMNRSAVDNSLDKGGKMHYVNDDDLESKVSGSDRILHYCNNLLILRRRRRAEIEGKDIERVGTHKLIVAATRSGGEFREGIPLLFDHNIVKFKELPISAGM